MPNNLWNKTHSGELEGLVYRSNLLGQDRSVANWGGGNTSVKTVEKDFRGRMTPMLWVKGSGADMATMRAAHFTALRMDDVNPLMERELMSDEEMIEYLTHSRVDSRHPRMSIETLLHAFLPFKHIDHTHPDAIISLCCAHNGKQLAQQLYAHRMVWVPYIRPGFSLSKQIADAVRANPRVELVLMEKHGLVTWGETSEACYHKTMAVIQEAEDFIKQRTQRISATEFLGGEKYKSLESERRQQIAAEILPIIRGLAGASQKVLLHYDDGENVLRFVNSMHAQRLSAVGAACPDHLVHTKRVPLYIPWDPQHDSVDALIQGLKAGIPRFIQEYEAYFNRNKSDSDSLAMPAPRVILIPGVGMVSTGKSKVAAEISAALYHRAIAVMQGSVVLGDFTSLNESESFAVEYWPLELYKLSLAPPEGPCSRQVALITGGAGGIGSATARRLLKEGAHVIIADLNIESAQKLSDELNASSGSGRAFAVKMDVTVETTVAAAFRDVILRYGGVDIVVNNAGLATSNSLEETTSQEWALNMNVLAMGYFLVAREAFKLMKQQKLGGAMVFVGSKNAIFAGKNASAYSAAKAASVHLARCIATEGGEFGIRVNTVMPDAVLQSSQIWNSTWREARAATYGIKPDQLEEHYRNRTLLLVNIFPEDIAEAIFFLASSKASKTTGCMITVDGGVQAAFTR